MIAGFWNCQNCADHWLDPAPGGKEGVTLMPVDQLYGMPRT